MTRFTLKRTARSLTLGVGCIGLALAASSAALAVDFDPVSCAGFWSNALYGEDDTGSLQNAIHDGRVQAAMNHGGLIEYWARPGLGLTGEVGGFLYRNEVSIMMLSRGSSAQLSPSSAFSTVSGDDVLAAGFAQPGTVTVMGCSRNAMIQDAIDDGLANAAVSFPADEIINWTSPAPPIGTSSRVTGDRELCFTIRASGASSSLDLEQVGPLDRAILTGEDMRGVSVVGVIGTNTDGDLDKALDNALDRAHAILDLDEFTYGICCFTGTYGRDGRQLINIAHVTIAVFVE